MHTSPKPLLTQNFCNWEKWSKTYNKIINRWFDQKIKKFYWRPGKLGHFLCFWAIFDVLGQGYWGSRGVKRGLLDPQRALFSPLEVLYGTKFGSKHHIMATMANVYKVCITDPFLDPWAPPGCPQRAVSWAKQAFLRPQIVLNMAFWPLKWSPGGPNWSRIPEWGILDQI